MFSTQDHDWMSRALALAEHGLNTTTPNPRVGCVIVREGEKVGEGWHHRAGEAHAEAIALAQAGSRARGATAYITLEPCNHFGRTPPCVDSLIGARVGRVIAAMEDPNPRVNGTGLAKLREAGIDVRCGLLGAQARALNIGFVSRMTRGLPWVRMKTAASLDGFTALSDGTSQWITGEAARADGHAWRARSCAILTGIGTVRDDNPQMTARHAPVERQPLKVLVDSRLEVDPHARILQGGSVLVVGAIENPQAERELRDRGAEVVLMPNAAGKVDLPVLMRELAARGVNELHVEAGFKLNGSLLREDCVDELLIYMAPKLLGQGIGVYDLAAPSQLSEARQLRFESVERLGDDVRVLARFSGRL